MAEQLTFDWPNGVALGAEDFFVSDTNSNAYSMVQTPDAWPDRKLVLVGPHWAGKTHLARIFAAQTGGTIYTAVDLPELPDHGAFVVIEDMHQIADRDQEKMFHLHNHLRNTNGTLLMTSTMPPSRWRLSLPDLASRMQATTVTTIDEPDDALLQALIMKLFGDRQLNPAPHLITYLSTRIERSYDAAWQIVDRLDQLSLEEGRPITRTLVARLLDNAP